MAETVSSAMIVAPRRDGRATRRTRRLWHVWMILFFLAAFLTTQTAFFGDAHIVIGTVAYLLLAARLAIGLMVPADSGLALRIPRVGDLFRRGRRRAAGLALMAAILLTAIGASAASGLTAHDGHRAETLHAALSYGALGLAAMHATILTVMVAA
jgi:hypothetical protein